MNAIEASVLGRFYGQLHELAESIRKEKAAAASQTVQAQDATAASRQSTEVNRRVNDTRLMSIVKKEGE